MRNFPPDSWYSFKLFIISSAKFHANIIAYSGLSSNNFSSVTTGMCIPGQNLPIFNELKAFIDTNGDCSVGNGKISAIISFRTEDGDSGATVSRDSYQRFNEESPFELIPITRNEDVINNFLQ